MHCGPPFGFENFLNIPQNHQKLNYLPVFKMKKCLFLSKEIVSIRIGWFGGRFWGKKILKWTKGGTTVCMSCGPPFGFDKKFYLKLNTCLWKNAIEIMLVFMDKGIEKQYCMFVFIKGNSID